MALVAACLNLVRAARMEGRAALTVLMGPLEETSDGQVCGAKLRVSPIRRPWVVRRRRRAKLGLKEPHLPVVAAQPKGLPRPKTLGQETRQVPLRHGELAVLKDRTSAATAAPPTAYEADVEVKSARAGIDTDLRTETGAPDIQEVATKASLGSPIKARQNAAREAGTYPGPSMEKPRQAIEPVLIMKRATP